MHRWENRSYTFRVFLSSIATEEAVIVGVPIDGEFRDGTHLLEIEDSNTDEYLANVAEAGKNARRVDVRLASRDGFGGVGPSKRGRNLREFADVLREDADGLAELTTRGIGRRIGPSMGRSTSSPECIDPSVGPLLSGDAIPKDDGDGRTRIGAKRGARLWRGSVSSSSRS